jgi:leader peptidase (prepilin peptidase) / N-methyltransferase
VTGLVATIAALFGLVIGSFLNVVIWRVPRKESIVHPRSRCPSCDTQLASRDNVPVASWILLRGRCRTCDAGISVRYPLVELLTGALFAAVGARFADSWALPAYLVLTAGLVALAAIDLEHYILPNRLVYPLGFAGWGLLAFASALEHDWSAFGRACAAGAVAYVFFFIVHVLSPRGMGFGDVRLSLVLGLYLGWLGWGELLAGLFLGFVYGAVVGVAVMAVVGMKGRKYQIPFGPFLALGAMTIILVGDPILDWYRGLGS